MKALRGASMLAIIGPAADMIRRDYLGKSLTLNGMILTRKDYLNEYSDAYALGDRNFTGYIIAE